MKLKAGIIMAAAALMSLGGCIAINVNEADEAINFTPAPSALLGSWDVSLNYDPDSAPSKTEFIVTDVTAGTFKGSFYGSEVQNGRYTIKGDELVFAGRTSDQSGTYWHSGRIKSHALIQGQTLSDGRNFLMTWTAKRK
jgi:hypothetical protein